MSGTELSVIEGTARDVQRLDYRLAITEEDVAVLKDTYARDLTDAELKLFINVAQQKGLSPMARQIHAVKRGGKMAIQTSIDGFRLIAQRSGSYAGQQGPWWCGADGKWMEFWPKSIGNPVAAKVEVLRHGFMAPMTAIATWDEYCQGDSPMWKKMPALMLGKCAESLALRKAFPEDLSGVYTDDEMGQAHEGIEPAAIEPESTSDVTDLIDELSDDAKVTLRSWWKANLPGNVRPAGVPKRHLGAVTVKIVELGAEDITDAEIVDDGRPFEEDGS